jgi:hypothetical protein
MPVKVEFLENWRTFKKGQVVTLPKSMTTSLCRKRPPWARVVTEEPVEEAVMVPEKREVETASIEPECEIHEAPTPPPKRKRRGRPKKEAVTNG